MREILVTNPSMIGTAIRDPNTGGIASGDALKRETSSMPHSLGTDDTEDSQKIREESEVLSAEDISNARKAHAAERSVAAAQPEHPDAPKAVDILTGGASPSAEHPAAAVRPEAVNLDDELPLGLRPNAGVGSGPAPSQAAVDV